MPHQQSYHGVFSKEISLVDGDPLKDLDRTFIGDEGNRLGCWSVSYVPELTKEFNKTNTFSLEKDSAYLVLITVYDKPIGSTDENEIVPTS